MTVAVLGGITGITLAFEPLPHADEYLVDRVTHAYDRTADGTLRAHDLTSEPFQRAYVFAAGTPPRVVVSILGHPSGAGRLPDGPVADGDALVVFMAGARVEEAELIPQRAVALSCLAQQRPRGIAASTVLHVSGVAIGGHHVLAVTAIPPMPGLLPSCAAL